MKTITETLRALREDNDLKQSDIAGVIGTTQQQYSKYETGESEVPLRVLAILTDRYKVSADYIIGLTDCREGLDALNEKVCAEYSVGELISDVCSLSEQNRQAVIEYIYLQKLKEKSKKEEL